MVCNSRPIGSMYGIIIFTYLSEQIIATSAEVTPNGGLVRDSPQNPLNSGLGIIVICPDLWLISFSIPYMDPSSSSNYAIASLFSCQALFFFVRKSAAELQIGQAFLEAHVLTLCLIRDSRDPLDPMSTGTHTSPILQGILDWEWYFWVPGN